MVMRSILLSFLVAGWSSICLAGDLQSGKYAIDPVHSQLGFGVSHLVISTVEGRFDRFNGTVTIAAPLDKSKVQVEAEVASINTNNSKRDDHLRSPDFFDSAKHPKMTFVSSGFQLKGDQLSIPGTLTIRGVSKEVTFSGKFLGAIKDPMGNGGQRAAAKVSTKISRKDFGLQWNKLAEAGPVVGDEVQIEISIEATSEK